MRMNEKGQRAASATIKVTADDFNNNNGTSVYRFHPRKYQRLMRFFLPIRIVTIIREQPVKP